ncbi:MAG: hypothetical protein AB1545_05555 [Thermodesulfobacteriota bacterium]
MKKIMLIGFALSLCATNAFAATTFDSSGGVGATTVLQGFKTSKMVEVAVNADVQTYAATADHANGTRVYGTASGDPLIYFMEKAEADIGTNKSADELGTVSDSSAFVGAAGWSSL